MVPTSTEPNWLHAHSAPHTQDRMRRDNTTCIARKCARIECSCWGFGRSRHDAHREKTHGGDACGSMPKGSEQVMRRGLGLASNPQSHMSAAKWLGSRICPIGSGAMQLADGQAHGAIMPWTSANCIALEPIGQILLPRDLLVTTHATQGCQPHQALCTCHAQTPELPLQAGPPMTAHPPHRTHIDWCDRPKARYAHVLMQLIVPPSRSVCDHAASAQAVGPEHIMPT